MERRTKRRNTRIPTITGVSLFYVVLRYNLKIQFMNHDMKSHKID